MHLDVLTPDCQQLLSQLRAFEGFYLAGGTALALQLGHRQSVDFDLFTERAIPRALLATVERQFGPARIRPLVTTADELTVMVAETKLTFLTYPFPVLEPFVDLAGVHALSVAELAATKAYTIGRRGSLKDYVDLYAVIARKVATLAQIVDLAQKKYGDRFSARLFLEQLVWLEDVENEPIIFIDEPVDRSTIQTFFESQIQAAASDILKEH